MKLQLSKQEIKNINIEHKKSVDKHFRMFAGIGSDLISVKNDTIELKIMLNDKWLAKNPLRQTFIQFLNDWRDYNKELQQAKYYNVSIFKSNPLGFVVDAKSSKEEIKENIRIFNLKKKETFLKVFTNKQTKIQLILSPKAILNNHIEDIILKIYLDMELVFYDADLAFFNRNIVYDEDDLYNDIISGMPTFLRFQNGYENSYFDYPEINYTKLKVGSLYAIMTFEYEGMYSTNAVTTVQRQELDNIEFYKFQNPNKSKLINRANKEKLEEIEFITNRINK